MPEPPYIVPPDRFPPRLDELGFRIAFLNGMEVILPPLCDVPAGPFLMGSDTRTDAQAWDDESPQHSLTLAAFQIGAFPVTVAEYACFVRCGHNEPTDWQKKLSTLKHPVVYVSWQDAIAYTKWLSERTGQPWRLPTEAEWEKAARGTDGRIYPWGNTFDPSRCNTSESNLGTTTYVGRYPSGASPYGAQDMAGNVWEWTSSLYEPYPYRATDGREQAVSMEDHALCVRRGGSHAYDARSARTAYRNHGQSGKFSIYVLDGFRVARSGA
jgi:toxoflavin biosynthesis protein ToxD